MSIKRRFEFPLPQQVKSLSDEQILNKIGLSTTLLESGEPITKANYKHLVEYRKYLIAVYKWRQLEPECPIIKK